MPITNIPPRLKILLALTDVLKEINPANGYEFDLTDDEHARPRVVRGRLVIGDDEPLPMVSILEQPMADEPIRTEHQRDNTINAGKWSLIVQGWAEGDKHNPSDIAYQLEAEVRKRFALEKKRPSARPGRGETRNYFGLGGLIYNFTIGQPVVRPAEGISPHGTFYFNLTLEIAEDMATDLG
ncbi:hypothetical protein [Aquamicrobium zhengzhouense]|uniref:Uncharacterized protein n=1 Tax=Aquamicrobium zhengzhouense TaxID=2781738 RepID=A0ABS0S9U2_9HYPH|nr:hypothetical protein [Aquamicrobium zhengzhouense]MBI1620017.1 hypothetical protein [Aquamicrobium zhengzhouense]